MSGEKGTGYFSPREVHGHPRLGSTEKSILSPFLLIEPLCRSILYEALSIGFSPPTPTTLSRLVNADSVAALVDAAAVLDAKLETEIAVRVRALTGGPVEPTLASLAERYSRLFGHTARGPVPPYETEHGEDTLFQKPQEMADLAGFLKAFGLVLDPRLHERIDHVSCELEFLSFLARKEAYALECDDQPMRLETRRATRLFLRDHLARFVPSFARRAMQADPGGFYGGLAALCLDVVRADCALFEAPLGPQMLRLRLPIEDRAPMACGWTNACDLGACGGEESLEQGEGPCGKLRGITDPTE